MKLKINECPIANIRSEQNDFKERFYLSWWIANLGVVPLLLFAAFLFLPAFVFLRALLFFVTRVFDTIFLLLQRKQLCKLRRIKYLPRLLSTVKAFALILLCVPALSHAELVKPQENQSLILSIGEIKELSLPHIDRFTLGSNDSVSHKFNASRKTLLVKGKKLGLSELHVWKKDGSRTVYQIYVLSRNNQLKLLSLAESLKNLGLTVISKGPWIELQGQLDSISNYKQFLKILKKDKEKLQLQIGLSKDLKKNLLTKSIGTLFKDHISGFRCEFSGIKLLCHLESGREPSPEIEKHLKQSLGTVFIRHQASNKKQNYRLKIKIIQVESSGGEAHGFGMHQLSGNLKGLFDQDWQSLYEKNEILLKDLGVEASLLAEPVTILRPEKKVKIQVGAEIPYTSTSAEGVQNTIFKFAGLKLVLLLKEQGDGYLIEYSAEITKPGSAGEISGSKESASARVSLSEPMELFEINFQTNAINKESLPLFGKIPFLGTLFSNTQKNKSFKKITGLILLEQR